MTIELTNGRLLQLDKVKSHYFRFTENGSVGVFEVTKEDGTTVLINWEHILFSSSKEDRKRTAPTLQMKEENSVEYRRAVSRIVYIEGWIRRAAPQWLEIDPENIIKWAHEEAGDEA